jgi:adenylyl cyclase-associated protein
LQEYQVGNRDLVIDIKDIKETVYIFRCENSLVRINGKVNSIAIGKRNTLTHNQIQSTHIHSLRQLNNIPQQTKQNTSHSHVTNDMYGYVFLLWNTDGCKKTSVVFENSLAVCEIVNCSAMEIQCLGKVPTITIDKTRGCHIFLSKEGASETDIITSESSEINVNVPKPDDSGDIQEFPVPTQYKSNYKDGKLVTEVVEHNG